jgi:tetratricopeptide (TPR) repeat protein
VIRGEYFREAARVAMRDGHAGEALDLARLGIAGCTDNPELYYCAGEAASRLAQQHGCTNTAALRKESVAMFGEGLRSFPFDTRLSLKMAMAQATAGNYQGATEMIVRAAKLDPNSSFVPAYKGVVELSFGYLDDAGAAFRQASEMGGEGAVIGRNGLQMVDLQREARGQLPAPTPIGNTNTPSSPAETRILPDMSGNSSDLENPLMPAPKESDR